VLPVKTSDFRAASSRCEIEIGRSTFAGDLDRYELHIAMDDVEVHADLFGEVPAWRPASGYYFFQNASGAESHFAWLPSVPDGTAWVSYRIGQERGHGLGTCYHDHIWGNARIDDITKNIFFGRAKVGSFSVAAVNVTAEKAYDGRILPGVMLVQDGVALATTRSKVRLLTAEEKVSPARTPYEVEYEYLENDDRYVVTFQEDSVARNDVFIERRRSPRLTRGFPARSGSEHLRFAGTVRVQQFSKGDIVSDVASTRGSWELFQFGAA
jgi:hypothetical protein